VVAVQPKDIMVTTRKKRETSRTVHSSAPSNAADEPSTSDARMSQHAFVPPRKGGRHALRKKKEAPPPDGDDQHVFKLLQAIAGQLKAEGLADEAWTTASVSDALRQAVQLLPAGLRQRLGAHDESTFEAHVDALLGMLGGDAGRVGARREETRQKRPRASRGGLPKGDASGSDAAPAVVCDAYYETQISSLDTGEASEVDRCAAAVMARVPASGRAVRALRERAEMESGQVLRVCVAVGGLCERIEERVAAFSAFTDLLEGGGVPEGVVRSAVSSVHAVMQGSTGERPESVWTAWREKDDYIAFTKASATCYRLVEAMVSARTRREASGVTEDNIGAFTQHALHVMHLLSPYAMFGLLMHVHDTKSAGIGDLVMLTAVLAAGGPTGDRNRVRPGNMAGHMSDATAFLLYLYAARCAIGAAQDAAMLTLSHQLRQKAASTMPPDSIRAWMEDQPPSSTIHLLMEKSERGLPEMSAYIVEEMKLDDLHALASLAVTGVGEHAATTDGVQERSAIDDLLFFESTEGALNVLPDGWEEDDDNDVDDVDDVEVDIDIDTGEDA
jgi:hypothetical protein